LTSVDPQTTEQLIAALTDIDQAQTPARFPSDPQIAALPGLYSWWGDETARSMIGEELGIPIPPLVYAGQAGATKWPSGTRSKATLGSRIRKNHINGNASSSTFRLTLSALLLSPLDLKVLKPGRLTPEDRKVVSIWIKDHLQVVIVPLARTCRGLRSRYSRPSLEPERKATHGSSHAPVGFPSPDQTPLMGDRSRSALPNAWLPQWLRCPLACH